MGRIPREPTHFVVRDELARLHRALERSTVAIVVTGLRGVGKTHLAAAYARSMFDSGHGLVGWVDAETPGSTLSGLADIAERLGVADRDGDSAVSARRLRDHLSGGADPAVLVFDNAADPDGLRDLLPTGGRTRILITSVDHSFKALGAAVDLGCFTRPEAVRYLAESTGLDADDGADQVAEDLGDLPLAVSAAAATIVGRRLGYAEYRQLLHHSPLPTALRRGAGHEYPRSVVQAILLCVNTTEAATDDYQLDVDVAWLLGAMAMLSPGGVHRSLFATSNRRIDEALDRCVAGSLLSWSTSGEALTMHRLVGRVLRERGRNTQRASVTPARAQGFPWAGPRSARNGRTRAVRARHHHGEYVSAGASLGATAGGSPSRRPDRCVVGHRNAGYQHQEALGGDARRPQLGCRAADRGRRYRQSAGIGAGRRRLP
ncbi:ATP-binding protein [Nocardia sp. XZ_19_369]|uniref:ATP-binding protein n=1 Tax=Nocardia sp. XZ_19_369 TaxID=2769487 RepID=UPI0027D26465|nr:ATP-binding protein [Nocardia sp. XZ_19_369]